MFRPNQDCVIHAASGKTDVYGTPVPGVKFNERCNVIKLNIINAKSSVRADTSASRGSARELEADAELLLTKTTIANVDDMVEVCGSKLRIASKLPRYNLQGQLDHFQITCSYWSN